MEEERLIHLLRGLPRETAPGGFTAQVLRRLDQEARPGPRRSPHPRRWHRLMVATASLAATTALGLSVGFSVGLLQRGHPAGPQGATAAAPSARLAAASPFDPAYRRAGVPGPAGRGVLALSARGALAGPALGPRPAASRSRAGLDPAQAHQLLRELQLESARLERELRSLRRTGAAYAGPPTVLYLGGDENVDLVLSTGRLRGPAQPLGDRDGGNDNNFLD
jgi:hypothetical protein